MKTRNIKLEFSRSKKRKKEKKKQEIKTRKVRGKIQENRN